MPPEHDERPIPPPPQTVPATPYAKELTEIVERIMDSVLTRLESRLDTLEEKIDQAATRDRLLFDKLADIERKQNEHGERIERLEARTAREMLGPPRGVKTLSDKAARKILTKKRGRA